VLRSMGTLSFLVVLFCVILASSMVFAPTLTHRNGRNSALMTGSQTMPTSCSSNCPAQQPPVMIGWGGLRLDSATTTCSSVCYHNSTYVPSDVFPGQNQTDMERLVVRMKAMGLNTIRVSFAPYCTSPAGDRDDSPYSSSDAQNMIKIANYYHFTISGSYFAMTATRIFPPLQLAGSITGNPLYNKSDHYTTRLFGSPSTSQTHQ